MLILFPTFHVAYTVGDTGCILVAKVLKNPNNPWNTRNNYTTSGAKRKTGLLNTVLIIEYE